MKSGKATLLLLSCLLWKIHIQCIIYWAFFHPIKFGALRLDFLQSFPVRGEPKIRLRSWNIEDWLGRRHCKKILELEICQQKSTAEWILILESLKNVIFHWTRLKSLPFLDHYTFPIPKDFCLRRTLFLSSNMSTGQEFLEACTARAFFDIMTEVFLLENPLKMHSNSRSGFSVEKIGFKILQYNSFLYQDNGDPFLHHSASFDLLE